MHSIWRGAGAPRHERVGARAHLVSTGDCHGRVCRLHRRAGAVVWTYALVLAVRARCAGIRGAPDDSRTGKRAPTKPISRVLSPRQRLGGDHLSRTPVTRHLMRPTRRRGRAIPERSETVLPPIRSCSRWGLPRPDGHPPAGELLPHHFTLARPEGRRRYVSVALSLRSPSLGVTQHPGPLEPGLSSRENLARGRPAWLRQRLAYHYAEPRSMFISRRAAV